MSGLQNPGVVGGASQIIQYQVIEAVIQLTSLPAIAPTGQMNIFPENVASGLTNYFDGDGTALTSALEGESCKFYGGKWIKQPFRFSLAGDTTVAIDATLKGDGRPTMPLGLADALATKLNGIEAGAQVNAKHEVKFACISADTDDGVLDSEIGFYNGSVQVQTGDINTTTRLDVPDAAAAIGLNPSSPGTDLDAVSTTRLFGDAVINGGQIHLAIVKQGTTNIIYMQAETIAVTTGGWTLTNLSWYGSETIAGTNDTWNIVAATSSGFHFTKDIPDLAAKLGLYVEKTELAGHENDFYLSYNNGFVANSYRAGDWVLSTDTDGPPTTPNQIGQPDIASGSGVVAFSARTRADADPNHLQWNSDSLATDYQTGDVIYASLPRDKGSHLKITLTSNGTLVGTGDSAYIWATADWVETGNIANVQDAGDYFTLSEFEPSSLRVRLPVQDVIGAVNVDGSNVTDALKAKIQGANEAKTLAQQFRVDVTNVDYYVAITLAGGINTNNTMRIRIPATAEDTEIDNDLERLLLPNAWVKVGNYLVDITTNVTRSKVGTSITYNFNFGVLTGTQPTGSTPVSLRVIGEDVHRGEIHRFAFNNEDWEDVLTAGTPADDDLLLYYDISAGDVKRVAKSELGGGGGFFKGFDSLSFGAWQPGYNTNYTNYGNTKVLTLSESGNDLLLMWGGQARESNETLTIKVQYKTSAAGSWIDGSTISFSLSSTFLYYRGILEVTGFTSTYAAVRLQAKSSNTAGSMRVNAGGLLEIYEVAGD